MLALHVLSVPTSAPSLSWRRFKFFLTKSSNKGNGNFQCVFLNRSALRDPLKQAPTSTIAGLYFIFYHTFCFLTSIICQVSPAAAPDIGLAVSSAGVRLVYNIDVDNLKHSSLWPLQLALACQSSAQLYSILFQIQTINYGCLEKLLSPSLFPYVVLN